MQRVDAYAVGIAAGRLGASRARKEDPVLPEVGIELLCKRGQEVRRGQPLCRLHAREAAALGDARELAATAWTVEEKPVSASPGVLEEISGDDLG